jgi:hypothetical protein
MNYRSFKTKCGDGKVGFPCQKGISRRGFLRGAISGFCFSIFHPFKWLSTAEANPVNPLFWIKNIPTQPFERNGNGNYHIGIDSLLRLLGNNGLKIYRSATETALSGASGLIEANDIVLIKVNGQWKYRGCTNSDLIRGLIQRILDHPDGFSGEVVIFENGQGRGSLNCDVPASSGYPDNSVHANANDESHSFLYLVNTVFNDPRVSAYLLDPITYYFIDSTDHSTQGYRIYENVSYPCFTTQGGHRIELREGIWQGNGYSQNLKLINVPVLKYHDYGGSEITASLKHFYGIVSMADPQVNFRHYDGLGETCGKMVASVRTPVLNIIDAIWVSHSSLAGYPPNTTFRANQILASQDPVALDYWAAKYIMYPISQNPRHTPLPSAPGGVIDHWLTVARDTINGRGGIYNSNSGIMVTTVTKNENEMLTHQISLGMMDFNGDGKPDILWRNPVTGENLVWFMNGTAVTGTASIDSCNPKWELMGVGDFNGDGKLDILWRDPVTGENLVWYMSGTTVMGTASIDSCDTSWKIVGTGDFNGDGRPDILWRNSSTGQDAVWYMNGITVTGFVLLDSVIDANWEIVGR